MLCMYFLYEIVASVTGNCHYGHIVGWEIKGKGGKKKEKKKEKRKNILYSVEPLKIKTKPNNPVFSIS